MHSYPSKIIVKNGTIYSEDKVIDNGFLMIDDDKISSIGTIDKLPKSEDYHVINLPSNYRIIPGMIDIHIHGANGADTMDATKESLDVIASTLPKEGTTSFLATTITEDSIAIEKALHNTGTYIQNSQTQGFAEVLGIHLEGPFIHENKAGAQPVKHILPPNISTFKRWQEISSNQIKLVSLAPELTGGIDLIKYLKQQNVISSIAHSQATYDEVVHAIQHGTSHVTHLFNQMTGLHHREPGIVGAAFLRDELMIELISDGIHIRPEIVKLTYKQLSDDRMILITDSMRAKWLENGKYDLGGQLVTVTDGKALLEEDTLAGSVLKMIDAFKNIQLYTGCSIISAIKMTSENPAKQLNMFDRKGSISTGKDADLVILDEKMDVFMTICKGKIAYTKQEENEYTL